MINYFTSVIFNKICLYVPMGLKNLAFHYGYSHSLCANDLIFTSSVSSFIEISNYIYFRGKYYQLLDKAHSSQENPTIGLTLPFNTDRLVWAAVSSLLLDLSTQTTLSPAPTTILNQTPHFVPSQMSQSWCSSCKV